MQIKKGDNVKVLVGKDAGKTGKVVRSFPKLNKVLVENINMKKRHKKATRQGAKGQVVEFPHPIHSSNVVKN